MGIHRLEFDNVKVEIDDKYVDNYLSIGLEGFDDISLSLSDTKKVVKFINTCIGIKGNMKVERNVDESR